MSINTDTTQVFPVLPGSQKARGHIETLTDQEIDGVSQNIETLQKLFEQQFGQKASQVVSALDKLAVVMEKLKPATAPTSKPFDFDHSIAFSFRDAISTLGQAIFGLMDIQPQLITSEMAVSSQLISPHMNSWNNAFLGILQYWQQVIATNNHQGGDPSAQNLATWQGDMQVANADSTSASTALNGVLSSQTSFTSAGTTSNQNLVQEAQSVVTALLNSMTTFIS